MGTVNREVVQVTTVNSTTEHAKRETPAGTSAVNWFDGPPAEENSTIGSPSRPTSSANPYQTTVTRITADPAPRESLWTRLRGLWPRFRGGFDHWCSKFSHMDPVKLAYLRTSFVFAISVLVTWTPSSINRVHDLIYTNNASFGLNLASSVVLPLQGVWNAVIFFTTGWKTLREDLHAFIDRRRGLPRGHLAATAARSERERAVQLERRIGSGGGGGGGGGAGATAAEGTDDADSDLSMTTQGSGQVAYGNKSNAGSGGGGGGNVRVMRDGGFADL